MSTGHVAPVTLLLSTEVVLFFIAKAAAKNAHAGANTELPYRRWKDDSYYNS